MPHSPPFFSFWFGPQAKYRVEYPGLSFLINTAIEVVVALLATFVFWSVFVLIPRNSSNAEPVDRDTCTCPCWDGKYKDGHSRDVGGKFYKSIYFNMDEYMGPIVLLCVGGFMILHITMRTITGLVWHGRVRWSALIALTACVYPVFYGFWAAFNYANDRYFALWYGQLFFTITELAVGSGVLLLCHKALPVEPLTVWAVVALAGAHALRSPMDQFSNAALGVRIMWASDLVVIAVMTIILLTEVLGTSRQGLAYQIATSALSAGKINFNLKLNAGTSSTVLPTAVPGTDMEMHATTVTGTDCMRKTGTGTETLAFAVASVASPSYTKRWMCADAAITLAVAFSLAAFVEAI